MPLPMTMVPSTSPRPGGWRASMRCHIITQEPAGCYVLGCALRTPHSSSHHRCHPLNVHATSLLARDRVANFCLSTCSEQGVKAYAIRFVFVFTPFWTYTANHGDFLLRSANKYLSPAGLRLLYESCVFLRYRICRMAIIFN